MIHSTPPGMTSMETTVETATQERVVMSILTEAKSLPAKIHMQDKQLTHSMFGLTMTLTEIHALTPAMLG